MVKIRLTRMGRKNDPFYRVIAIDESKKTNGKALAILGHWYPKKETVQINEAEIKNWVAKGAVVSPAVKKLLSTK